MVSPFPLTALPDSIALPESVALPLVEIELPWNPPSLTQIPPMQLFVGLIVLTALALVGLYFYRNPSKNE